MLASAVFNNFDRNHLRMSLSHVVSLQLIVLLMCTKLNVCFLLYAACSMLNIDLFAFFNMNHMINIGHADVMSIIYHLISCLLAVIE